MTTRRSAVSRSRSANTPRDLDAAVHDLGIRVQRGDDEEIVAYCPMHLERTGREERHPSFAVNRNTGLFNCFSCGYRGQFIDLVNDVLHEGNDLFGAARWIRTYGIDLDRARNVAATIAEAQAPVVVEQEQIDEASLALYDDPPDWALEKRSISVAACHHFGLLWQDKRDLWIIPIRNADGRLIGWQRKEEGGKYVRNYPKGVPKAQTLFGLAQFPLGAVAVLVESPLDVAHAWTLGFEGFVASYGAAVTDEQMRLLLAVTDEVIVALDNDDTGHQYSEALRAGVRERGRLKRKPWAPRFAAGMRFIRYDRHTESKDPGDMDESEIERSLANSQHWTVARFETSGSDDRGTGAAGLPAAGGGSHARPWASAGVRATGRRQDGNRDPRHGAVARAPRR